MKAHTEIATLGGEVGCTFSTKEDGDVSLDMKLPDAMKSQKGGGNGDVMKHMVESIVGTLIKPFLVPADLVASQYDIAARDDKGRTVVDLTRFSDKAAWESATLYFSKDGLLEKQVGTPNVDPNDMMAAASAGVEIEITFDYKKRGDQYTIEGGRMTDGMGESTVKISYYDLEGQAPLPMELEMTTPMVTEPVVIALHDYVLNGKAIVATARKPETKTEPKPVAKEPAKPAPPASDPPKPADPK
jgi:hypothetical protein